jgi:hypothetical protein
MLSEYTPVAPFPNRPHLSELGIRETKSCERAVKESFRLQKGSAWLAATSQGRGRGTSMSRQRPNSGKREKEGMRESIQRRGERGKGKGERGEGKGERGEGKGRGGSGREREGGRRERGERET